MKRLPAIAAFLAATTAWPTQACTYSQIPEEVGDGSARFFANEMVAAATYVDLVLVEDDGTRPMNDAATHVLTLRSIAHLKGNGPDRFSLFGAGMTLQQDAERVFAAPLQHFTQEDGRVTPFPYNAEYQGNLFPPALRPGVPPPPPPPPPSSCGPSSLAGQTGRFYVVMRGSDGRLLNNFSLYGDSRHPAFAFVPVTLEQDDNWLRAVLGALPRPATVQEPSVLYLREGADPARVEASLRRSGVTPLAAYVQTGERLDEVRPSDSETGSPWLTRAVPLVVARNRGGLGDADHAAAEFLRSKLGFEQVYGGLSYQVAQAYLASVRRKQRSARATPRLLAVALSGPTGAIAAATRESFAGALRPLPPARPSNLELPGQSEAVRFAAMQSIERDIWLMNGGNGNRAGTLPTDHR